MMITVVDRHMAIAPVEARHLAAHEPEVGP